MIYPDAPQVQDDHQHPLLLVALAADSVLWDESFPIYSAINTHVMRENQAVDIELIEDKVYKT